MSRYRVLFVPLSILAALAVGWYWHASSVPVSIKEPIDVIDVVLYPDGGSMLVSASDAEGSRIAIERVERLGRPADKRLYAINYLCGFVPVRHRVDQDGAARTAVALALNRYIERNTTSKQREALKSNDLAKLPKDIDAKIVGAYQLKSAVESRD